MSAFASLSSATWHIPSCQPSQRSSTGTPLNAELICMPHPRQVYFPHVEHAHFIHLFTLRRRVKCTQVLERCRQYSQRKYSVCVSLRMKSCSTQESCDRAIRDKGRHGSTLRDACLLDRSLLSRRTDYRRRVQRPSVTETTEYSGRPSKFG